MSGLPDPVRIPAWKKAVGWAVHGYHLSGLLLAAWVTIILMRPERLMDDYRVCFLLLFVGGSIVASATVLARVLRITRSVTVVDGRRLGALVGFVIYVCLPLLLLDRADLLSNNQEWVLLVALVASGYGLSRADAMTPDGEFRGFPPYWNVVAFYLFALPVTGEWAALVILILSGATIVPTRYPNPARRGLMNGLMLVLSLAWGVLVFLSVIRHWHFRPLPPRSLIGLSAGYPTLYLAVAWGMSLWRWAYGGAPK